MIDRQAGVAGLEAGDTGQRHQLARIGFDVNLVERGRLQLIFRIHFQHDVMLVVLLVKGRDLSLTECVVEGVVDGLGRDAELGGGIAVDDDIALQAVRLLIAVDVPQLRDFAELVEQLGGPVVKGAEVGGCQRVLVERGGEPAAGPDVLNGLKPQGYAGNDCRFAAKPIDDLVHVHLSFRDRLKADEHAAVVQGRVARWRRR